MATVINFPIDAGSTFEASIDVLNEDGSIFDLSGLEAFAQMRRSYYTSTFIDIDTSVIDPAGGVIKLKLLPTQTENIKASRYVYDVEVVDPADTTYKKRVIEGIITIKPNVTR